MGVLATPAGAQPATAQEGTAREGAAQAAAEPAAIASADRTLVVGTKVSPPFSMKQEDGSWTGVSIELWERVADELDLQYEYRELPLDGLIEELTSGELDAAVAALSVTAERQQQVEFCHPHFSTGLGIAVPVGSHADVLHLLRRVVSPRLLAIVAVMVAVVAVCGLLFWRFERDVNQAHFGGERRKGIQMGLWWSTILLMGHKGIVPVSLAGRLVAGSAMVASLLLLSVLTGVITSVLTVQQLDHGIDDPSQLRQSRVVTVSHSTAADYLRRRRIAYRAVDDPEAALRAIAQGSADAAVYDRPLLQHLVNDRFSTDVRVLPVTFNTQEYAIALPPDSPLRKPLNTAILRFRASDLWDELTYRYLGE